MFENLIGNNPNKEIFRRLVKTDRIPHSLLFVGKDGIGKKQFALEIAKSFVCQNPKEFGACNDCKNCRRAEKFNFPKPDAKKEEYEQVFFSEHSDIGMVIPYKNSILVNSIRDLEKEANFRPYEAKVRIFIIDDAEKLSTSIDNAANALLKTLEEPSETTYIFLITSRPSSLLPTILSRCQTIHFAPIDSSKIEEHLINNEKISSEDAKLTAKISRGSIGTALETNLEKYRERRKKMIGVLESLSLQKGFSNLLRTAEDLSDAKNKDYYEKTLEILQTLIHDILTIQNNPNSEIINFDLTADLTKLSKYINHKTLSNWLLEIENLRENLNSNLNRKIATNALFMKMAK
ncbi:MAG: AAA family ATPase [Acidobacteriota bacterium]|jgi:DNA polymerase-3 subunit delta'|nr:AAA family ATPase [Acidobacteriota bacterium]